LTSFSSARSKEELFIFYFFSGCKIGGADEIILLNVIIIVTLAPILQSFLNPIRESDAIFNFS
jgi:hypothetical protein